ncbi:protoporphyrinogen oxidase [Mycolicibacterium conceptionense]|uniref:Protoporphyrinogen oxidase n=1 Tax=Mycolicibacterium conceptionense TaxID=451644 RepID=A0A0U1DT01_9MYCO|nr:protoporphyrinogen oxidase [Mycolicibacterium conceptionense]
MVLLAGWPVAEAAAVVALALPGGTPLPQQSGVLVAAGERLNAKAITMSSRKWGRRGNVEMVRLSFGRYGDDMARSTGDEDLLAWSARDLNTLFGVAVEPVDSHVHRWIDAMPQYGPGHLDLVAELRAGLPATLAVAGGYLDGIGGARMCGHRHPGGRGTGVQRRGTIGAWPSSTMTN